MLNFGRVYIRAIHTKNNIYTYTLGYHVILHADIIYMFVLGLASKHHVAANNFHLETEKLKQHPLPFGHFVEGPY